MIISSLIQTILSVPEFHRIGCKLQFTDYNRRSGIHNECSPLSHPAPKNSSSFYVTIVCVWSGDVNCFLRYFRAFWDFFSFFPVKGFLMYFYMILHKLSLICHQIVTKSHRGTVSLTNIQKTQPLHFIADPLVIQMIIYIISDSQILLTDKCLQHLEVTSLCSHFRNIGMPADVW